MNGDGVADVVTENATTWGALTNNQNGAGSTTGPGADLRHRDSRPVACRHGVADRLLGRGTARQQVVVGKLGEVRFQVPGVQPLEPLGELAVQARTPSRGQVLVDGVADQHVGEAQPSLAIGHVAHEARGHRLLERRDEAVLVQAADRLQRLDVELAPDHRRQAEHVPAGVRHR